MHRASGMLVAAVALILFPLSSWAAWLDADAPDTWNQRGSSVPTAPPVQGNDDPRCREGERPVETPEDRAVAAKGWRLFHDYQGGWGLKVIWALSGYDGMCRPWGYQVFVFVRGVFAGTMSPDPMNSRNDASLFSVQLLPRLAGPLPLVVTFERYADNDPLCCPSRRTLVRYRVDRSQRVPLLIPVSASTSPVER
ncbi:MAG TPA: LppP/LprE family lipoprotein [Candidatus Methylomirabilis sp.]|nr:LppP/LprE family lipoprotein [Candidatus Methylomirabilis sp.]